MRGAFVVRLGPESRPASCQFEGWVEEVDTGNELRFRSTEDLLRFLGRHYAKPPHLKAGKKGGGAERKNVL
jgi:hypothetical protein